MADNIEDQIAESALKPQEVSGDAGKVKMPPLPDLIAVADRAKASEAVAVPGFGLRFQKIRQPGAI